MPIPIYSQQVGVPKPPRLRKQVSAEAAKAGAIGQFAGQVQQVGTAFAGRLFDLAAQNEINNALITAKEQWQTFKHGLQTDPEYTTYKDKFDTFYSGLRDTIWGGLKMSKARTELEQRLESQKVDWESEVQKYSDDRAIDHAFTTMERGINLDIVNKDQASVNQRINEAIATGIVAEQDGEHIRQMSLVQIHANILDFPANILWLSTEEPTTIYGISREERLSLVGQYKNEWGLMKDRENKALGQEIERIELDFMDRLQKGNPPDWEEIRDSTLPRNRKEHYQGLINDISKQARKAEEERLEAQQKEFKRIQEEVEAGRRSAAYLQAYSEIIDWPMNQEERVEDRILADELLENNEKESLIDEYRKRNKEAQDAAKQKGPLEITDDSTLSELIRMFYDSDVPNDAIKAFIEARHGYGLSNTDTKTWQDKLKTRDPYQVHKLAVDMVKQYYDDLLKEETSETKILTSRKQEALIIKKIADEAAKGKLTEDGLLQFASNLLVEPKKQRVGGFLSRMETEEEFEERTEPEIKEATAAEAYEQEMVGRFTEWKGVAPVSVGENEAGELVFGDGTWWYVYRRRAWYRWDGSRWRMLTK